MSDESNITLPENDPDLILAREIGSRLSSGSGLSGVGNDFIELLLDYKNTEQSHKSTYRPDSKAIWSGIEKTTSSKSSATILPFYKEAGFRAWAAAAAVIIVAFIGVYWYLQPSKQLLAKSGAAIEMVTLPDGSEVTLRPYSSIMQSGRRSYKMEGEAYFSVVHDPQRSFSVEVGDAKITVLGTRFIASSWGEQSQVFLEEGSVKFENRATREAVILKPGQSSTLKNERITSSDTAEALEFTDWINNTLVLNDHTFKEVVNEIEQHYNIQIRLSDPSFEASGIDGTYRLASADSTLSDIGLLVGGTFTKESESVYRFDPIE